MLLLIAIRGDIRILIGEVEDLVVLAVEAPVAEVGSVVLVAVVLAVVEPVEAGNKHKFRFTSL